MKSFGDPHVKALIWVETLIAILAILATFRALHRLFRYLSSKITHFHLFSLPLIIALIGSAFLYLLHRTCLYLAWETISFYMPALKKSLAVIVLTTLAIGYTKTHFEKLFKRSKELALSIGKLKSIRQLLYCIIYLIAALFIFQIYGFNIMPVLTFGGIAVAALALASQDILSNFFGGLMIFFKRPFYEGDTILIPSAFHFKGTVTQVGLYATIFQDENKDYAYFPNSLFCKSLIINTSRTKQSQITGVITLPSETCSQCSQCIKTLRKNISKEANFSITDSAFNDTHLSFTCSLSFEKIALDALVEKKALMYNLLRDSLSPFKGTIEFKN